MIEKYSSLTHYSDKKQNIKVNMVFMFSKLIKTKANLQLWVSLLMLL